MKSCSECRCYSYIEDDTKHICGVKANGYIFPCTNPECCVGGCVKTYGKGNRIPQVDLDTPMKVLVVVVLLTLVATSLKM